MHCFGVTTLSLRRAHKYCSADINLEPNQLHKDLNSPITRARAFNPFSPRLQRSNYCIVHIVLMWFSGVFVCDMNFILHVHKRRLGWGWRMWERGEVGWMGGGSNGICDRCRASVLNDIYSSTPITFETSFHVSIESHRWSISCPTRQLR